MCPYMFQKIQLIWMGHPNVGLIFLYIDRCEKWMAAVIGNGFCACNSHISEHFEILFWYCSLCYCNNPQHPMGTTDSKQTRGVYA